MAVSIISEPCLDGVRCIFAEVGPKTIPANGYMDFDFRSSIPAGKTLVAISGVRLSGYPLPYFEGNAKTWVAKIAGSSIRIQNTAGAWTNYTVSAIIYVK